MKLYQKKKEMSTAMGIFLGIIASMDFGAIMGELMALAYCAYWSRPVPTIFQAAGWALLIINAAVLAAYMYPRVRRIRWGVIPPEVICDIMEDKV